MVASDIKNFEAFSSVVPCYTDVLAFILEGRYPEVGVWEQIADNVRVIRLRDFNRDNKFFESHSVNFDLHYTIKGTDCMSMSFESDNVSVVKPYDEKLDYSLFGAIEEVRVILGRGRWILINPGEPHRNEFLTEDTEKLVFKIKVDRV